MGNAQKGHNKTAAAPKWSCHKVVYPLDQETVKGPFQTATCYYQS